ncbi:MAG: TonB-dependent receptor [Alphaproteobacteria bacterium]|nr:TonB-dependent receptor [Alphaproteobacteria bacterium]
MKLPFSLLFALKRGVAVLALAGALGLSLPAHCETASPFSISVDGEQVDASGETRADKQKADAGLAAADIQVKFDGLGVKPILNVSTFPVQVNFRSGEHIRFLASFNYAAWIDHGEIRVISQEAPAGAQPFAVIPIGANGAAEWVMPDNAPAAMDYVLRVYDAMGRFDETRALPLKHATGNLPIAPEDKDAVAPGYGEDRTAFRNISVLGGALTVSGKNIPKDHEVRVMGEPVPVDNHDGFVVQRILPPGAHAVDVSVLQDGKGLTFSREVEIPENEWFAVGLADLTVGHNFGNGIIEHTGVDEFPGTWTRGRAAMYLKGKIKGQYILTASADTGEGTLQDMFTGLAGKDPNAMLKRISPNDYYPVYGDDSTAMADAPTSGKLYVRLERGPSAVMWGNFKSNITGTKFMASSRTLYGASGVYRSDDVTKDGAPKKAVDVYAAQPSTVPQTDVFRGTGGSAYFMQHQDITAGSDIVSVEVRNAVTGWVIARTQLSPSTDYRFDPVNGVLILNAPLPATNSAGYENYLVVHYDYQPVASDGNAYIYGGRAETWVGDHVRVGVTALREKEQSADQTIYGGDVRLQASKSTYVEAEVAHSEGPGFGSAYSVDGGLSLQTTPGAGVVGVPANGWRVEGAASLDEVTKGAAKGEVSGRYEHYDPGFSSPETQATAETIKWGVAADAKVASDVKAKGSYSETDVFGQSTLKAGDARLSVPVSKKATVEPYATYAEQTGSTVALTQNGQRGEAGVKLIYDFDRDHQAYVFGQGTVALSGTMLRDDRAGIGAKAKITDKITASAEVSQGTQGVDVTGSIDYAPTVDDRYTLGYRRDPFRSSSPSTPYLLNGEDLGTVNFGARHRFNEQWLAYNENSFDFFGARESLTDSYGVQYTPDKAWKVDGAVEIGRVIDNTVNPSTHLKNPDLYRQAASLAVIYHEPEGLDGKVKGELRHDLSDDGSSEVMAYLLQVGLGAKMSKDWRALANLDVVWSNANDSTKDSAYISGVIGAAYRPAKSDRLNALFKYNFLYDNPGAGQVTVDGTTSSPAQMSHILSADATYQLTQKLALGGKYGFRIGEIKDRSLGADWTFSEAHLGIIRLDYHIVNEWDAMAEGRALWSPTSGTTDYGFVAAIYRELGDNFKIGIGYNFGDFSDDISHIAHDNHGVFINLIGKF